MLAALSHTLEQLGSASSLTEIGSADGKGVLLRLRILFVAYGIYIYRGSISNKSLIPATDTNYYRDLVILYPY